MRDVSCCHTVKLVQPLEQVHRVTFRHLQHLEHRRARRVKCELPYLGCHKLLQHMWSCCGRPQELYCVRQLRLHTRRLTKTRMQLPLSSNNVKLCRHDHIDAFKNIFVTSQPATNADVQKSFVVLSSRDGTYRHLTNTPMHLLPGSNKVKLCRHNHIGAFQNLWVPSARILMCRTFADFILSSLCTILHDTCASTSKHLPPSAPP